MHTIPFGQYRGRLLSEIEDIPYLRWMLSTCDLARWPGLADAIRARLGQPARPAATDLAIVKDRVRDLHRQLARRYHPDAGGTDAEIAVVNECFDQLRVLGL